MTYYTPISLHFQDKNTALVYAAGKGYTDVVTMLVEAGAKVDILDVVSINSVQFVLFWH